jgi:dihydrofolate reductase
MISAIVAVDNSWGIGFNGDLLEHIPEDLKYFKELTSGHCVMMGRKTWESLPKKPLPNRTNIVITNNPNKYNDAEFMDLFNATLYLIYNKNDDIFIIGGGKIYEELLPMCDRVYVTKIFKDHDQVDTYFPNLDKSDEWAPAACSAIYEYEDLTYQFWQYDRI